MTRIAWDGKTMKTTPFSKVLSASVLCVALSIGTGQATAADLGGNCCADLEERIAELEATTARKGNRKVSLSVTGWVSSQLFYFDDGFEDNVYVVDNSNDLSTNFKFTGSAQIVPGWKAGYTLWVYTDPGNSLVSNQDVVGGGAGIALEHAFWWIESDKYGKVSVGKQSLGADNAVVMTDFTGTLFPANAVTFDGSFMKLRPKGGNPGSAGYATGIDGNWGNFAWCESAALGIGNDCAGLRLNGVRYDTPTIAGFVASASWGEDDYWDVALRYAGEHAGFKFAAATAYAEVSDAGIGPLGPVGDSQYFEIGGTLKHVASGLWVHGYFGHTEADDPDVPDGDGYYVKAGLSRGYFPIGQTHMYAEYGQNLDTRSSTDACATFAGAGGNIAAACALDGGATAFTESTLSRYGLGVVQDIDAASMTLWAKWRRMELDTTLAGPVSGTVNQEFEPIDMFLAGAVIFF